MSNEISKVECAFPMVILSEFRMGQYRDDDYRDEAPHFIESSVRFGFVNPIVAGH